MTIHTALSSLMTQLKTGQRFTQTLPTGSSDALLLGQLAQLAARTTVIVTEHPYEAQRLTAELKYFSPSLRVAQLPDWETLPYDAFSPHHDLVSERLQTLFSLTQNQCDVLVVPVTTALYRLSPPSFLLGRTFSFKQNESLDAQQLREQLVNAGYQVVSQVVAPSEFAIRGGLIDLFPMGSALPYRIDLFDDTIESIKVFDVDTQRTLYPVPSVQMLPGREYPTDEASRGIFRNAWRERFEGDASKHTIYKDVANGIFNAGIEYYLPLFFEATVSLFDYLPSDALVVLHGQLESAIAPFWQDTQNRFNFLKADTTPILSPDELFLTEEAFFSGLKAFSQLSLRADNDNTDLRELTSAVPDIRVTNQQRDEPYLALQHLCQQNTIQGIPTLIMAESLGRATTLTETFERHGISAAPFDDWASVPLLNARVYISHAPIERGFFLKDDTQPLCIITETELYAQTSEQRTRRRTSGKTSNVDMMIASLSELHEGDPVVHSEHGIGRYKGLITMNLGDGDTEFLHLSYANNTALYVPVSQLSVISRYAGSDPEHAPLHTLGTDRWSKTRQKAAEQIRDTAAELLNLYARRAVRPGHAFELDLADYEVFANDFGFETTPDQASAIAAVTHDLIAAKPMDRLVCGDVGFGKTEVALRAAFIAAMGGKQVAVLAPTTLLAEQHFQTFSDRFAKWPIKIAEVSRFNTGKQTTAALAGLENGAIDIVIGTHKLLSDDVKFARLGLVIIDEEHRFGVRQKEQLKNLRAEVDILTLTATPIPRTMSMAMEGVRDLSVIATAPQKRLAIKTFVRKEENAVIREAILRELKRGGQVYFLHNEVSTIQNRRHQLETLIPEARIAIAHGQMHERELEGVMRDFYHQRANVLLCSTIIETGIDVPNANTIIMHRADKFGLSQLHQLRGRVGRSHHQAYAYLLIHSEDALTSQAKRRLDAICQMEELGSGFFLAMQDMEIRGAGEVLGDKQSGNMYEIGFSLYNDMLNAAIKALRQGKQPDLSKPLGITTDINLHTPALLPAIYCIDVNERLQLYKRLASVTTEQELSDLQEEIIDRFGKLPEPAQALIETHRLRLAALELGITKIDVADNLGHIHFDANSSVDGLKIIQLIQKDKNVQLNGQNKLKMTYKMPTLNDRVTQIKTIFHALT
ncbi:transcription-repair coupling factor [Formosimonas limnophila]|nr:transcription-repair coupling factor [Formosimonas limnophila]